MRRPCKSVPDSEKLLNRPSHAQRLNYLADGSALCSTTLV